MALSIMKYIMIVSSFLTGIIVALNVLLQRYVLQACIYKNEPKSKLNTLEEEVKKSILLPLNDNEEI